MYRTAVATLALLAFASNANADRPVTDQERQQLVAAVSAAGCTGGKFEHDDGKFEVDDAMCNDGLKYDLDFDASFKLIKKERDN